MESEWDPSRISKSWNIKSNQVRILFLKKGVEFMTHHDEKGEKKKDDDEAKVEPIHPSEQRGGKKKGLLDTCK
jgi:hypothetical protein